MLLLEVRLCPLPSTALLTQEEVLSTLPPMELGGEQSSLMIFYQSCIHAQDCWTIVLHVPERRGQEVLSLLYRGYIDGASPPSRQRELSLHLDSLQLLNLAMLRQPQPFSPTP
jgi:hypothetical protein